MSSSKKIEECVQQPLELIGRFHFGIGPIITSTSILLLAIVGGINFGDYDEKYHFLIILTLISIYAFLKNLLMGWLWTKLISKSITSQQPINPMYLSMMSILYLYGVIAPIYGILKSNFIYMEELKTDPSFFIINVEQSILAIFSLFHIFKIVEYYKFSTPAQNVNNLFKNKGGRNITTKVKKPPQKSTIGKR